MRDWFEGLAERERLALMLGAVALVLVLFFVAVWQPVADRNRSLAAELEERNHDLAWMASAAVQIKALEGNSETAQVDDGRTLIARVTSELRADKVEAGQIRPEGENRLRLTIEGVRFTALLPPLERLRNRYGVRVREAAVEPAATAGLVDARLVLERGGGR